MKSVERIVLTKRALRARPVRHVVQPRAHLKPNGLWYACGSKWIDFLCSSYGAPRSLASYRYIAWLTVDTRRVLRLTTLADVRAFSAEFGEPFEDEPDMMIQWGRVAKVWDGIEICPYRMRDKPSWFRAWEVASGCVWRNRSVRIVEQVRFNSRDYCREQVVW